MRVLRVLGVTGLLLLVALAQGSVVARLTWFDPGEPQMAALAVLGVALMAGARAGAVAGFGTGLLLDVLPPADHATGQWAFVLCLLGYLVGLLAADAVDSKLLATALAAVGASLAPLVFTVLGLVLGDSRADLLGALERLPSVALWTGTAALLTLPLRYRRRRVEPPVLIEATSSRVPMVVR